MELRFSPVSKVLMDQEDHQLEPEPTPLFAMSQRDGGSIDKQIIDLCIQEYIALRSEQRTRLDSANKIINYYALVVAAAVGGLLTVYTRVDPATFKSAFQLVMLLIPLVTLPFAFTQQNEEIFVRHIGKYCDELKSQISSKVDHRYWLWEDYHNLKVSQSRMLRFTGFFRSGLLILFSVISLLILTTSYAVAGELVWPLEWYRSVRIPSREFAIGALMVFDWILIASASVVGIHMTRASSKVISEKQSLRVGDENPESAQD